MKKLYIFDFDGVIADTGDDIAAAVKAAQRHFKACKVRGKKNILSFVGYGAEYLIKHTVTGENEVTSAKLQEVVNLYKEYYYEHCADKSKLYSGVEELLKALRAKGAFVCMFTNKPKRVTERSLKIFGIYDLFDHIFCPEDLGERKPSPEGIIKCMEACGVSAEDTLMIGDSAADIVAAKAAGVSSCGVLLGLGDREKMQAEGPDFTVYFASEVLKEKPCAEIVKKSPKKTKKKGNVHKTIFFALQLAGYFFCGGFFANECGDLFSRGFLSSIIMLFLMFLVIIVL
jgi:phosphoglycolate phosphatase